MMMNLTELIKRTGAKFSSGKFLLAEPYMQDKNFKRSVVFLCEHREEGSLGFIINKPMQLNLSDVLFDLFDFDAPLYYGGPVEPDTLHFLHQLGDKIDGSERITENIHWGGNFEQLKELMLKNELDRDKIRFFLGYSGWDKSQLQAELDGLSWFVTDPDHAYIFEDDPNKLWRTILNDLGGEYRVVSNFPEDPRFN